jgi:Phage integrase central domain
VACIEPHWATKTETMSRVRGRIESVLAWATVRGYRNGDNPAAWRNHLDQVLPARGSIAKVAHHPALPYAEIPTFCAQLRTQAGTAARGLEFLILTAARALGDLLPRIAANDVEVEYINNHARPSGAERLLVAELVARGLEGFVKNLHTNSTDYRGVALAGFRVFAA